MGYGLIPPVASIALAIHHVALTDASRLSKLTVVTVVAVSFAVSHFWPQWTVLAILMQVGASIYMLLYLRVHAYGRR
jgi:hypothetical protein